MSSLPFLVVNAGSSSLKLALIEPASGRSLSQAIAENLLTPQSRVRLQGDPGETQQIAESDLNHRQALELILPKLEALASLEAPLPGVGHRVVHGGEHFRSSVRVDQEVLRKIESCNQLAPLHNPWALKGIHSLLESRPGLPQVAVFDTAFHQTLPPHSFRYALPETLYTKGHVRRYGFHGISYAYLLEETAARLGRPAESLSLLLAHLGNGCSACAVREGRSVDTTMGLTPLEGLTMGTRSGDVDPNLLLYLHDTMGLSLEDGTSLLNKQSGLLGLSGRSNDMREILEGVQSGDPACLLAFEVFCFRLAKGLLGLTASLDRVDALVFSGGIGEHAAAVREKTLSHLRLLGVVIDPERNAQHGAESAGLISAPESAFPCQVVPTNEELRIAREASRLLLP
ncbi:MAG: acetate kinase [Verrucomicrobiota bacterium]